MRWPSKRMTLWGTSNSVTRVNVNVLWPRYLWLRDACDCGLPQSHATLGEEVREYKNNGRLVEGVGGKETEQ